MESYTSESRNRRPERINHGICFDQLDFFAINVMETQEGFKSELDIF